MSKSSFPLRKNPFPAVAHAGSLGLELTGVTVQTKSFVDVLNRIALTPTATEPQAMVLVGEAGSGKTHFLKYTQFNYGKSKALRIANKDAQEPAELRVSFDLVIYLDVPGSSFREFAKSFCKLALIGNFFLSLIDKLVAYPIIKMCEKKAKEGEDFETNTRIARDLTTNPAQISAYWNRFSKSEVFDSVMGIVEQVSKHSGFKEIFLKIVRSLRDDEPANPSELLVGLLGVARGPSDFEDLSHIAAHSEQDFVDVLTSLFALFSLLGIRLLLLVDESQDLLREENRSDVNLRFRAVINATPRQSLFLFAMRTEHWLTFRDEATERRVRYFKLSVTSDEATEIIDTYVLVKGEVLDRGNNPELFRQIFPRTVVESVWNANDRIIGKILTCLYGVVEEVLLSKGQRTVEDVVARIATRGSGWPSLEELATSARETLDNALVRSALLVRQSFVTVGREFDFAVFRDSQSAEPLLLIRVSSARDDAEEAENAAEVSRAICDVRKSFSQVRLLVVLVGYTSPDAIALLQQVADAVDVFARSEPLFHKQVQLSVETQLKDALAEVARHQGVTDELHQLDLLVGLARKRAAERRQLTLRKVTWRAMSPRQWIRLPRIRYLIAGIIAAIAGLIAASYLRPLPSSVSVSFKNLTSNSAFSFLETDPSLKLSAEIEQLPTLTSLVYGHDRLPDTGSKRSITARPIERVTSPLDEPAPEILGSGLRVQIMDGLPISDGYLTRRVRQLLGRSAQSIEVQLLPRAASGYFLRLNVTGYPRSPEVVSFTVPEGESANGISILTAALIDELLGETGCKSMPAFIGFLSIVNLQLLDAEIPLYRLNFLNTYADDLSSSMAKDCGAEYNYIAGVSLWALGAKADYLAVSQFKAALRKNRQLVGAYYYLAIMAIDHGDIDGARNLVKEAMSSDENFVYRYFPPNIISL